MSSSQRPEPGVTVRVYEVRSDADIAVARLAADGIQATVHQDDEGGLNPGFYKRYGVRVVVRDVDAVDAFTSLGIERIVLPEGVVAGMFAHARWCYPHEACGLVGFDSDDRPAFCVALTNDTASPDRFVIDPVEHFGVIGLFDRLGLRVGGVFHSHPQSDAVPSDADVDGGGDPDWVHFIIGPVSTGRAFVRAYRIDGGAVEEISVTVQP